MKLLISDYDGTLDYGFLSVKYNLPSIKKFIELGNKFCIATANNYPYMYKELNNNGLRPNYLSLSNGLVLMDKHFFVVDAKIIGKETKKELIYLSNSFSDGKIVSFNEYNRHSEDNVIQLEGCAKGLSALRNIYQHINFYFPEYNFINNGLKFYIRKRSNKVDSVNKIKEIENVEDKDIYTIGNDLQDLEMIKKYNGYNTPFSNPRIVSESNGTVGSVKKLIKSIS